MQTLKNLIIAALAIWGIISSTASYAAETDAGTSGEPVKIGFILPLTGDAASIGQAMQNAAQLSHQQLPDSVRARISLHFDDDGMQQKNTITAFNRLVAEHDIDVVLNATSGTANALAPVSEKRAIPLIAIATDPKVVSARKYAVNLWVTPEAEMRALVPEVKKRGYKRIVRVSTIHDFSLTMKGAFDRDPGVQEVGLQVVLDEEYSSDVKDFKTLIAKIKRQSDIDAILLILMPGQLGEFARQLRQAQVTLPLFGFEILEDSNEVKVSQGALIGAWYVNAADASAKFMTDFRQKYPDSSLFGAANAYDAVQLVARAIEQGKDSSEEINSFLHEVRDFRGALGTYSATGDNRFSLPAAVKVVTAQGFEQVR